MWLLEAVAGGLLHGVAAVILVALLPSSWTRPDRVRRFLIGLCLLFAGVSWVVAADLMLSAESEAATARDATYGGVFFVVGGFAMVGFALVAAADKQDGPR